MFVWFSCWPWQSYCWAIQIVSRCSGISAGVRFSQGATCLAFWKWKRDNLSATVLDFHALCFARNTMLYERVHKTNLRIKRIFKTSTTAWLSDRNKTFEFTIYFPHNSNAITIGKRSLTAIWWQCKDLVQEFANYQIRRHSLYFLMRP